MKKLLSAIVVFLAVFAFAQKPENVGKKEFLVFEINAVTPYGVEYTTETGSKAIRIEMQNIKTKNIMRITQKWPRTNETEFAVINPKNNNVNWVACQVSTFIVLNPKENDSYGVMTFESNIGNRGIGIPSANAVFVGELEIEYLATQKRYAIKSGFGTLAGKNNPSKCEAWELVEPATLGLNSKSFPVWGTFTVKRFDNLTTAQIKEILK